jgi:hypothetical protein
MAATSSTDVAKATERLNPIVLDLGKHKKKSVKQLRNGKGRLIEEAMDSIEELQRVGTIPASAQPIILIVREKQRSRGMFPMVFGR